MGRRRRDDRYTSKVGASKRRPFRVLHSPPQGAISGGGPVSPGCDCDTPGPDPPDCTNLGPPDASGEFCTHAAPGDIEGHVYAPIPVSGLGWSVGQPFAYSFDAKVGPLGGEELSVSCSGMFARVHRGLLDVDDFGVDGDPDPLKWQAYGAGTWEVLGGRLRYTAQTTDDIGILKCISPKVGQRSEVCVQADFYRPDNSRPHHGLLGKMNDGATQFYIAYVGKQVIALSVLEVAAVYRRVTHNYSEIDHTQITVSEPWTQKFWTKDNLQRQGLDERFAAGEFTQDEADGLLTGDGFTGLWCGAQQPTDGFGLGQTLDNPSEFGRVRVMESNEVIIRGVPAGYTVDILAVNETQGGETQRVQIQTSNGSDMVFFSAAGDFAHDFPYTHFVVDDDQGQQIVNCEIPDGIYGGDIYQFDPGGQLEPESETSGDKRSTIRLEVLDAAGTVLLAVEPTGASTLDYIRIEQPALTLPANAATLQFVQWARGAGDTFGCVKNLQMNIGLEPCEFSPPGDGGTGSGDVNPGIVGAGVPTAVRSAESGAITTGERIDLISDDNAHQYINLLPPESGREHLVAGAGDQLGTRYVVLLSDVGLYPGDLFGLTFRAKGTGAITPDNPPATGDPPTNTTDPATAVERAFPGAYGFGADAWTGIDRASATPEVYFVTNLNNQGPGSFREGLENTDPDKVRFIVPRVGGNIPLEGTGLGYAFVGGQSGSKDRSPKGPVYIACQCAPGGLQLTSKLGVDGRPEEFNGLRFRRSQDVIMRCLRVRPGVRYDPHQPDPQHTAIGLTHGCRRIIFDHISGAWGNDDILGSQIGNIIAPQGHLTIQRSILGVNGARHPTVCVIGAVSPFPFQVHSGNTAYLNLLAYGYRVINWEQQQAGQQINCVVFDWGSRGPNIKWPHELADPDVVNRVDLIGNVLKKGTRDSREIVAMFYGHNSDRPFPPGLQLYISGNEMWESNETVILGASAEQWDFVKNHSFSSVDEARHRRLTPLHDTPGGPRIVVPILTASATWDHVVGPASSEPDVGACFEIDTNGQRVLNRDAHDAQTLTDVRSGTYGGSAVRTDRFADEVEAAATGLGIPALVGGTPYALGPDGKLGLGFHNTHCAGQAPGGSDLIWRDVAFDGRWIFEHFLNSTNPHTGEDLGWA